MRYLSAHAQHIGSRTQQQDFYGIAEPNEAFRAHGGLLVVMCDGMGGMEHGDVASRVAVESLLVAYAHKHPEESIPEALARSVREANAKVVAAARGLVRTEGMGTTLVAAVVHDRSLYYASVGDSALFHVSAGTIRMVNRHHVYANVLDQAAERGAITKDFAAQHPEREALTSFVGIDPMREIDSNVEPCPLQEGDTILLASDGMFKTLDREGIAAALTGHPQSWPEVLVARTLGREHPAQDNVTVVSVTLAPDDMEPWMPIHETLLMRAALWTRWWPLVAVAVLAVLAGLVWLWRTRH